MRRPRWTSSSSMRSRRPMSRGAGDAGSPVIAFSPLFNLLGGRLCRSLTTFPSRSTKTRLRHSLTPNDRPSGRPDPVLHSRDARRTIRQELADHRKYCRQKPHQPVPNSSSTGPSRRSTPLASRRFLRYEIDRHLRLRPSIPSGFSSSRVEFFAAAMPSSSRDRFVEGTSPHMSCSYSDVLTAILIDLWRRPARRVRRPHLRKTFKIPDRSLLGRTGSAPLRQNFTLVEDAGMPAGSHSPTATSIPAPPAPAWQNRSPNRPPHQSQRQPRRTTRHSSGPVSQGCRTANRVGCSARQKVSFHMPVKPAAEPAPAKPAVIDVPWCAAS